MKKAILATKIGMTQIFNADGVLVPVTVLEAGPCVVTQIKTVENDGYSAVQVGFGDKKEKVVEKADGFFSFFGRRSVTSVRLTSSPSRQASAAASRVMSTNTATTSSSVKDQERWMTLRENTFPTVSTRISSVEITRTIFSTAASAFMIFL